MVRTLLRLYSYFFLAAFAVVSLAMAVLMLVSGPQTVNFYLLPWETWTRTVRISALIGLALVGILVLLMAVRGKLQIVYIAWSVLALALIARYCFLSPQSYTPVAGGFTAALLKSGDFICALLLILAAIIAVLGASMRPVAKAG
jgi:hypothetical protein